MRPPCAGSGCMAESQPSSLENTVENTVMKLLTARGILSIAALAALAACSPDSAITSSAIIGPNASVNANASTGLSMRLLHTRVCPSAAPGEAACHSLVRVDNAGNPLATSGPTGYVPADLLAAYKLAS